MNLLLITGAHPYEESNPCCNIYKRSGHESPIRVSRRTGRGPFSLFDAIVLNTFRQEATNNDLTGGQREGLGKGFVSGGGPYYQFIFREHLSLIGLNQKKLRWRMGTWRKLAPTLWLVPGIFKDTDHPITEGVSDFWTYDECYCGLDIQPGVDIFMHGIVEGEEKPLGWSHQLGKAK
ncbi:MAG: hypothetical protein Ct9H300mP19_04140 [Dehalococcoidia bacterium]|nr:MAG: hypothetical protein Ct9H300mP19_04140 [Dehalococcoidia bacterium]